GLVSPHLENPADFPKPVFISKGLCRDTPQLIYINVVKHLRKLKKMSNRYIILSFFQSLGLNACDNRTQKKFFDKIVYDTYHSNYEGIITHKYIDKYNHARPVVVIEEQIFGKKQMDFMFESSDLFDFFKVGDTIIKKNKSLT